MDTSSIINLYNTNIIGVIYDIYGRHRRYNMLY